MHRDCPDVASGLQLEPELLKEPGQGEQGEGLAQLLTNAPSIRDVLLFPLMRPQ